MTPQHTPETFTSALGRYVTARIKGEIYPLQGWVISDDPPTIWHQDGTTSICEGVPTVVINPPEKPSSCPV